MKPATTLKEILKPPFRYDKDNSGDVYCTNADDEYTRVLQVRKWGVFHHFENGKQLQDEFEEFVMKALNEKWERDFGEPLRWILMDGRNDIVTCPYCRLDYRFGIFIDWEKNNYCPRCGKKVKLPEGKGK